ncbi:MAG TPA: Crp/Fnr family transcriptional regulator [Bacteroidia bacterium]|nr:Crp/Fnr family transcriptional regulator [Bacteroidia bacterium]
MLLKKSRIATAPPCEECTTRSTSMFCNVELMQLQKLSSEKTSSTYKKGQTIFYEDRQPHGVYCIYSGKVKIHKSGENGQEQIVRFARPGSIIGYRALLNGDNYSASATALENTVACYFPKHTFIELLKSNQDFSLLTIRQLASDLRTAEHMLTSMAHKFVDERMAEALILLKECYGFEAETSTINAVLSRRELASITGTTTETAIRVISDFKDKNLIRINGKRIEILDIEKLYKIANI